MYTIEAPQRVSKCVGGVLDFFVFQIYAAVRIAGVSVKNEVDCIHERAVFVLQGYLCGLGDSSQTRERCSCVKTDVDILELLHGLVLVVPRR